MTGKSAQAPRVVECPRCGAPVSWTLAAKFRPFCSERCKFVDLGDWATERYRVAGDEAPPDDTTQEH